MEVGWQDEEKQDKIGKKAEDLLSAEDQTKLKVKRQTDGSNQTLGHLSYNILFQRTSNSRRGLLIVIHLAAKARKKKKAAAAAAAKAES